jgi:hypothetical protein
MARFAGGTQVQGGYYWNPRGWEVEVVGNEGGTLSGSADQKFLKVPFLLLFAILPMMGLMFMMFLPAIGFVLFAYAIAKKLTGGVKESAKELASTVSPGWQPGEAHFTGKPGEEGQRNTPELEKLAKEIADKKAHR